jgi:hypothetical protein
MLSCTDINMSFLFSDSTLCFVRCFEVEVSHHSRTNLCNTSNQPPGSSQVLCTLKASFACCKKECYNTIAVACITMMCVQNSSLWRKIRQSNRWDILACTENKFEVLSGLQETHLMLGCNVMLCNRGRAFQITRCGKRKRRLMSSCMTGLPRRRCSCLRT